jgi:hypothetical protein
LSRTTGVITAGRLSLSITSLGGRAFAKTINDTKFMNSKIISVVLASWIISAHAETIVLKSDSNTLAAAQSNLPALDTGDVSGLTFQSVLVGSYGTGTPVPPGAPAGTEIVQIPPGDGQHGFFLVTFVLPQAFSEIQLTGEANADDYGRIFLNGHPLTPSLTSGDLGRVSQFGNVTFGATNSQWFVSGTNALLIADWNIGGGPSGAGFHAAVSFAPLPPSPALDIRLSQVELCWETTTNFLYQLEYREGLTTNGWHPLGSPVLGTGTRFCTNDAILLGQPRRFYQLSVTNAP